MTSLMRIPQQKADELRQKQPGTLTFTLLRLLADGEFHSGEVLARQLGVSRTGVSNALRGVATYGLVLYSVRGRGYKLVNPPQWLDARHIVRHLDKLGKFFQIEILDSATSSNTLLLQRAAPNAAHGRVSGGSVLAVEWQSGGRGRMGRVWHSGLGSALTFSLLWRFECGLSALSGLSLAAGVALVRALHALGVQGVGLKWPNDVMADMKLAQRDTVPLARLRERETRGPAGVAKLAGILIEAQGDMLGPSAVVIGIGMNLSLPQPLADQIGQPVVNLADIADAPPERNLLLAVILRELHGVLHEFVAHGFAALRAEWESYHVWQGQPVQLLLPDGGSVDGVARGVTEDGALILETAQGVRKFNVGEVGMRSGSVHVAA